MHLKIHGGTAPGTSDSLCYSCRYATIVRGTRLSEEVIECSRIDEDHRIAFAVKFCNRFSDRSLPSLDHMEDIAWILRTDVKRHQVGFVKPSDSRIPVISRFDE